MIAAAVWNELRPAPTVPDLVLAHVPYVAVGRARRTTCSGSRPTCRSRSRSSGCAPRTFARYTVTAGLVSLARGATLVAHRPRRARPRDRRPGHRRPRRRSTPSSRSSRPGRSSRRTRWPPTSRRTSSSPATPPRRSCSRCTCGAFLACACRRSRRTPLVVASVFLSHLHYAIDVAGAYAVAFSIFVLREGWGRAGAGPGAGDTIGA